MPRHQVVIALLCVLATLAEPLSAQTRPDFSGTWTRVEADPEVPAVATAGDQVFRTGTPGSGWGSPLNIRHDARQLIVEYAHFSAYDLQPPIVLSFALDGSESRNTLMIGHTQTTQHSHTTWRGEQLVITTTVEAPGQRSDLRTQVSQALTLESRDTLAVETTRAGIAGASSSVTRTLYRRAGV